MPLGPWLTIKDGDPVARELFRRHYSYNVRRDQMSLFPGPKDRNYMLFVGPGEKTVLITADGKAMFVWRKFISMDKQPGVNNAIFRNEGSAAGKAQDLIRAADEIAWQRWPGERLYTYVDPGKVRTKKNPGHCFIMAGYRQCGVTKSGLLIFEKLPKRDSNPTVENPV